MPSAVVGQRRVPHGDSPLRRGRAVLVDQADVLQAGQALGQLDRIGDGGGGQQEARCSAVGGRDPPEAPQNVGHVRAEHAAVDVRLVDDHHGQVGEQLCPGGVVGQDPHVQHVGVGQHHVGALAYLRPRLARRVAVVDGRAHPLGQPERRKRPGLVLGERLGGVQVQRARARVAAEHVQRGQVEAHRLAGRGAGGDDGGPRPGGVDGLRLMGVEALDPQAYKRRRHFGVQLGRHVDQARLAGSFACLAHESAIGAPGVQQRAPRLGCAVDGQGLEIVGGMSMTAAERWAQTRSFHHSRYTAERIAAERRAKHHGVPARARVR